MKSVILALGAVGLAGCSASGPVFEAVAPPTNGQALVYIYRLPNTPFNARRAYFYVDNVKVAELNQNGYTRIYALPGHHTLTQKWPLDVALGRTTQLSASWEPGKTYYYDMESGASYGRIEWRIAAIDPFRGSQEIVTYHYQPALNAEPPR